MTDAVEQVATAARILASQFDTILPPLEVLRECRAMADAYDDVLETVIGHTETGHPIPAYVSGAGERHVLLYGFPDPGEAVGGTTILSLMRGLVGRDARLAALDVTWHFIPCLNLDDQPNNGQALATVSRDRSIREVDWCVSTPRSETTALLDYAAAVSPAFTFPLHDEYHSGEQIPLYLIVSKCLDPATSSDVRTCLESLGLTLSDHNPHKVMGAGFSVASELAGAEYPNSTFSIIENYGLVAICEVAKQDGVSDSTLVAAQVALALIMIDTVLLD